MRMLMYRCLWFGCMQIDMLLNVGDPAYQQLVSLR